MLTQLDTLTTQEVSPALKSMSLLKLLSYMQQELGGENGGENGNEPELPLSANAQTFYDSVKKMIDKPDFKSAFLHAIDKLYQGNENHNWEDFNLTKRETQIAELLLKGLSYKEIASRLFICMDTIFSHIRNIYAKIHVHSRSEMAAKFI